MMTRDGYEIFLIAIMIMLIMIGCQIDSGFKKINTQAIRQNEQLLYENAQLQSANVRLLEELSEGFVDWEDVE